MIWALVAMCWVLIILSGALCCVTLETKARAERAEAALRGKETRP